MAPFKLRVDFCRGSLAAGNRLEFSRYSRSCFDVGALRGTWVEG